MQVAKKKATKFYVASAIALIVFFIFNKADKKPGEGIVHGATKPIARFFSNAGRWFDKQYSFFSSIGIMKKSNEQLLEELNELKYYQKPPPKSLGREWLEKEFIPILDKYTISIEDKIRTIYEHIAGQINQPIQSLNKGKILVTGGGAHNIFLIERLVKNTKHQIITPETQIIDFKEAIIFAFLGVLRLRDEVNCLASVTGAKKDNSGGSMISI